MNFGVFDVNVRRALDDNWSERLASCSCLVYAEKLYVGVRSVQRSKLVSSLLNKILYFYPIDFISILKITPATVALR